MEWLHSHDREAALPPEKLARLFALARRGADAADEIERLKAALAHADAKGQENDKLLWGTIKDNERLRAEIKLLSHPTSTGTNATDYGLRTTRAALKEDGDA